MIMVLAISSLTYFFFLSPSHIYDHTYCVLVHCYSCSLLYLRRFKDDDLIPSLSLDLIRQLVFFTSCTMKMVPISHYLVIKLYHEAFICC